MHWWGSRASRRYIMVDVKHQGEILVKDELPSVSETTRPGSTGPLSISLPHSLKNGERSSQFWEIVIEKLDWTPIVTGQQGSDSGSEVRCGSRRRSSTVLNKLLRCLARVPRWTLSPCHTFGQGDAPSLSESSSMLLLHLFLYPHPFEASGFPAFFFLSAKLLWILQMQLRSFQGMASPASRHSSRNPTLSSNCQEPLWVTADESYTAHAFEAFYQNLMLSLTDLHTTMVCLICFFIKSIMGLIEKIGSATCNLTTDLDVCRRKGASHT